MYIAEVLSKFPVVQHFPFGALFQWERDPLAPSPAQGPLARGKSSSQAPKNVRPTKLNMPLSSASGAPAFVGTAAPWARHAHVQDPSRVDDRSKSGK